MSSLSLAGHADVFRQKLAIRRTNSLQPYIRAAATRGNLRHIIADARSSMPDVINVFRCVLHQMCCLTYSDWQCGGYTSWDYRWKAVSREGFDILRGRLLGYGNQEYRAILQWLYLQDTECAKFIDWLADWWPELHPINADQRKQPCLEMQGDVIEISLAALRGNRYFDLKSSRWLTARYSQPTLFVQVCQFCRLVQFLDAAVDSGWVKGSQRRITKLQGDPEFRNDAFIGAWINGKLNRGNSLLHLLNVATF